LSSLAELIQPLQAALSADGGEGAHGVRLGRMNGMIWERGWPISCAERLFRTERR
jgi:hypothetical protein